MSIEKELLAATGAKVVKGETRQSFLERLANSCDDLDAEAWEAISLEAATWLNAMVDIRNALKSRNFPDCEVAPFSKNSPV